MDGRVAGKARTVIGAGCTRVVTGQAKLIHAIRKEELLAIALRSCHIDYPVFGGVTARTAGPRNTC